ncbi:MAG TPA: hypothetical protein VNA21_13120 [Steroidobacteraceae bacterium]|nr:hypothetical protein [Steroidobacteraceae bacterium]
MQSRVLNALAALALMLPIGGHAADFGYSFVDLAIIPEAEIESGNFDVDGDGFQLRGSLAVAQNFFALVEIESIEFDDDVDFTRWIVGAGAHWPINQRLDFVARGGLVRYDIDYGRFDDDDIGFFLGGRVRAQVIQNVEVEGGVDLTTAEVAGFEDEITLVGEGRYHFNSQFSVGGLINLGDDSSQIGIYGRYNF